jgi:SAM-dependent methyltransferase
MLRLASRARLHAWRPSLATPGRGGLSGSRPGPGSRPLGRHSLASAATDAAAATTTPTHQPPPPPPPSPPPTPWRLYDHPPLYDALFSFHRDFAAEVAFVARALAAHGGGGEREMKRFLDVGCGPARHARAAAAAGATALALDASPAMLAYAAAQAAAEGVAISTVHADVTAPAAGEGLLLPPHHPPVDAALAALGTLAHATAPGAPASAFTALASSLRPGGVLVIELAAADDVFDGTLIGGDAWDGSAGRGVVEAAVMESGEAPPLPSHEEEPSSSSSASASPAGFGARRSGNGGGAPTAPPPAAPTARLLVEYGAPDDPWDAAAQVLTRTVRVSEAVPVVAAGGSGKKKGGRPGPGAHAGRKQQPATRRRLIGEEAVPQRVFTPQEVRLLGDAAGLEVVAEYGDMDEGVPAVGGGGDRYVAVLVKRA